MSVGGDEEGVAVRVDATSDIVRAGLAGGARQQFGTQLALETTQLLAACDVAMGVRQPTASRVR